MDKRNYFRGGSVKMELGFEKINVYNDGGEKPFEPGKIIVEPLERGFGHTIGNAIRRIALSSMPGASVVGVKIKGILHEFTAIPGTSMDATKLILNLKNMRFKVEGSGLHVCTFKTSQSGFYTAKDITLPEGVTILNGDQAFINVSGTEEVEIEIYVRNGRGYVPAEQITDFEQESQVIAVDGTFSPIKRVGYQVENMRLGQDVTYERLIFTIETDGSITAKDAVMLAAKIASSHFDFFHGVSDIADKTEVYQEKIEEENRVLDMRIEMLDLSVRSFNGLKRDGRTTVRKILELTETELYSIDNLGKKSVKEIIDKINEMGLELKSEK